MIEFRKVMTNHIEFRFEPLTEEQTRINPERAKRLKQAEGDIRLEEIISKSRETCILPGTNRRKNSKISRSDLQGRKDKNWRDHSLSKSESVWREPCCWYSERRAFLGFGRI
jgi:hypothetical protein